MAEGLYLIGSPQDIVARGLVGKERVDILSYYNICYIMGFNSSLKFHSGGLLLEKVSE